MLKSDDSMIRVTRVRVWLVVRSLLVYILINLILIVIRSEMHYMKKWFEMNFERIHGRNNKTWQKNRLPFFFESWIKETEPRKKEISKYKNTEISRRVFHIIIKRDFLLPLLSSGRNYESKEGIHSISRKFYPVANKLYRRVRASFQNSRQK